nr:hypothetical protein [Yersinia similis]
MLPDISGIGLDVFVEQPALFPLEGFAFTPKAPLTGVFQCFFQLLDITGLSLVSLRLLLKVRE